MKKVIMLTMCGMAMMTAGAQKANVEQAKKLAGKTDKIEEARSLIKEAIANPETSDDVLTYYTAGKIEWDAYDKNAAKQMINPESVNVIDMADELLNGYNYFLKVFPLDQIPNEKGEVKPKYTKELQQKFQKKHPDFWNAAINYYNADLTYPQAYQAFLIHAEMPGLEVLGKYAPEMADTVRGQSYVNAANMAYNAGKYDEAAAAYRKTHENNYGDSKVFLYEIACWENIQKNDSTRIDEARDNIFAVSKAGYEKYGMEEPLFLNTMVSALVDENKTDDALALLNESIEKYPDHAFIYGLRGYTYDRAGNNDASEADYRKAASMDNADYETLRLASRKLLRDGQAKWNEIELGDPDIVAKKNAVRENYFMAAKEMAERARTLTDDTSQIDSVLEDIDYLMSLK